MNMANKDRTVNEEFEEIRNMIKALKEPAAEHTHSRSRVNCPECRSKFEVCEGCGQVIPDNSPIYPEHDLDDDDDEENDDEED